jgi:hypothetical protein
LKYSQIYPDKNITWFGLTESLFHRDYVHFVLFIVGDSDTVLVTPYESIQDIDNFVKLAPSNLTYEIHIDPDYYTVSETPWNLNQYLNDYEQLRI